MHDIIFDEVPAGLGTVLAERGFTELTPIQTAILNPDIADRDLRISSQTGSGKTVALGLVVAEEVAEAVNLVNRGPVRARPSVLLVAPTRELAVQLTEELSWLYKPLGATVVSLTGGTSIGIDFRELKRDPQVLVGTPGRVRDHLERGSLLLDRVRVVALDEADEMLAMGFEEEVSAILDATPEDRRTHLVSATFPARVRSVAARHQRDSLMIAGTAPGESNSDIDYRTMVVAANQRLSVLVNVLLMEPEAKTLIFVRTRLDTTGLADALADLGFAARPLSGDLNQRERTSTLNAFRRGQTPILVATDVAARGLDVQDIAQVIHVDLPENSEMLTHRSGRTGRAGRKGRSLIFVPPRAVRRVDFMLRDAGIHADQDRESQPQRHLRFRRQAADRKILGDRHRRSQRRRPPPEGGRRACSRTATPSLWSQPSSPRPTTADRACRVKSFPLASKTAGSPGPAARGHSGAHRATGPGSRSAGAVPTAPIRDGCWPSPADAATSPARMWAPSRSAADRP